MISSQFLFSVGLMDRMVLLVSGESMSEGPWTIGAAIAAGLGTLATIIVLGITWYATFWSPKKRLKLLATPVNAAFIVAEQHHVEELVLPANSECEISLLLSPRVYFRSDRFLFGCRGDPKQRPIIREFHNVFVEAGIGRHGIPGQTLGHERLTSGLYQITGQRVWTLKSHTRWGFLVKTQAPGMYPVEIALHGEESEGKADNLKIRVIDPEQAHQYARCVNPEHNRCLVRASDAAIAK